MDNTILQQGRFTSDGSSIVIDLRSDVDWMMVYNITQAAAAQTTAVGVKYYWQRGFPNGAKWVTFKSNAANAANLDQYLTSNGFTLLDSSLQTQGSYHAIGSGVGGTAISNAAIPVATNSGVNGLVAGDIVRFSPVTGGNQLAGLDFTVGYNTLTNTTFSLDYMAQIVAATTFGWRKIEFNPIFYPRRRYITSITQAAEAVVTLSVTHGYQVGQLVRMVVPSSYGMSQMNGILATIIDIDTDTAAGNTITLNVDSSSFDAFAFPLTAAAPFSPAECVPVGEDTATALSFGVDVLSDATLNTAFIGLELAGGASNPAGADNDVIYWVAGKSFSVNNA
jgi:hypothetical protein